MAILQGNGAGTSDIPPAGKIPGRRGNRSAAKSLTLMVISAFKLPVSNCPECGAAGRFVGIERSADRGNVNLITFECDSCGSYAVEKTAQKRSGRVFRNEKTQ